MYRNLVAWSRSLRFLQLAVSILLFLLILPFIGGHPYISFFFQLLLLNALLVSLSASDRLPRLRWVLMVLWSAGMVLSSSTTCFRDRAAPIGAGAGGVFLPAVSGGLHRRHPHLCL